MKKTLLLTLLLALCLLLTGCGQKENAVAVRPSYAGIEVENGVRTDYVLLQDGNRYALSKAQGGYTTVYRVEFVWGQMDQNVTLEGNGETYVLHLQNGDIGDIDLVYEGHPVSGSLRPNTDVNITLESGSSFSINYNEERMLLTQRGTTLVLNRLADDAALSFVEVDENTQQAEAIFTVVDENTLRLVEPNAGAGELDQYDAYTMTTDALTLGVREYSFELDATDTWSPVPSGMTAKLAFIRGDNAWTMRTFHQDGSFTDLVLQPQ